MQKIKVLCPTDASFGSSGYATYARQVLAGLHQTGKYDITELGCFAQSHDPRVKTLPWKFVGNVPMDPSQMQLYNQGRNPYGQFLFEQLVLDLEPDVVMDFRDAYMFEFEEVSPFRDYFYWVILAAVDSAPPPDNWLASYRNADAVLSYEQFGIDVMNEYGCGQIKTIGIAPPSPDGIYQFVTDRGAAKQTLGLNPSLFSIGTVMRNQPRKLFSELIEVFSQYLKMVPLDIAAKSVLHLHTAYPDAGWAIPQLLKQTDCSHKIIFTYMCDACGAVFATHFTDGKQYCKRCGNASAHTPNVANGLTTETLAKIYQSFDCYVQYSNCEGFGVPMVEAGGTGAYVFATDYSAMSDVIRKVGGLPIRSAAMNRDALSGSHQIRAVPDINDAAVKLKEFACKSTMERGKLSYNTAKTTCENYKWRDTVDAWDKAIQFALKNKKKNWQSPVKIHTPNMKIPDIKDNNEFIEWCYDNIAGRPEMKRKFIYYQMMRGLNDGCIVSGGNIQPYTREMVVNECVNICQVFNIWEQRRANKFNLKTEG